MASSLEIDLPVELATQLGERYRRYGTTGLRQHASLIESVVRPADVALEAVDRGDHHWTVTVCTSDCLGALSIISGLFTAWRFDILSADIFTVRLDDRRPSVASARRRRYGRPRGPVGPQAPDRVLLDIFEVHALALDGQEVWDRFRDDLATLTSKLVDGRWEAARDEIIDRVSEAIRAAGSLEAKLLPVSIDVANEPGADVTKLTVRSGDTPGFLFSFTNALAGLTVNIEQAQIRTAGDSADDTFWVTTIHGKPIATLDQVHELRVATALIKQFTYLLPRSPDPGQAMRQFNALIGQMLSRPQWTAELANLDSPAVLEALADLMGVSRFLWEDFLRLQHENLFPVLLDPPALQEQRLLEQFREGLEQTLAEASSHDEKIEKLNAFKDREMFRIDLRHVTGRSDFDGFAKELSWLAEATVDAAARLSNESTGRLYGTPRLADGRPSRWSVCGLGKFGGQELGFGSDLELIFVYEDEGSTDGQSIVLNSQYFGQFVQSFRKTVLARQEGVFEIDLRLRPHGKAGALASSLEGFRQYYSDEGASEQFERMALVRLRPVAGDQVLGDQIKRARDAFVYSGRPMDVANVLHLRRRQANELVPAGKFSAKYSHGGLVDVEYFVQVWQIAVGHTNPSVRVTNTLEAIRRLAECGQLPAALADELSSTYGFLRRLIDALRVVLGHAKDLTVPAVDSREYAYLAHRLRLESSGELESALRGRMAFASSLWDTVLPGW